MSFSIKIVGHRGLGCTDSAFAKERNGDVPIPLENTMASFASAIPLANYIKTDLIATKDNQIVLIHSNDFLQHVTEANRTVDECFIADMNLVEVRSLRLGTDGHGRIPSLHDLLKLLQA